jgi:hypothetical protein
LPDSTTNPDIKPRHFGGRTVAQIERALDERIAALIGPLQGRPIDATRLLDTALIEALAADLCDQGRRPGRTTYHRVSWDVAGRTNAGPPETTQREWWRHYAREVLAWVAERLAETPPCPCCLGDPDVVCDACGQHDCWAGRFMCHDAMGAGTTTAAEYAKTNPEATP